jgi:hypothetical protein
MSGRQNAAGHHRPYDSSATAVDRAAENSRNSIVTVTPPKGRFQ